MKIKTAEATGLQLDWGVAVAVGGNPEIKRGKVYVPFAFMEGAALKLYRHTEPAVCMGLIEQHKIDITHESNCICASGQEWSAEHDLAYGKTLAEAVARCVISMQLGDEFECPSELGVQS